MIDAVFFDFDGVLAESADLKQVAFAQLFADAPEPARGAILAFLAANPGLSRYAKFERIHREWLGRPLDADGMAALSARFAALVVEAVVACPAPPGVDDFLAARQAAGTPMFVASATPQDELRHIVARRGLAKWFVETRGAPRAKADNIGDLLAAYRLNPARCVMIGDGMQDHQAAAAHGLRFIGRVPAGAANPFPADVFTVADFHALALAWPALFSQTA